MKEVIYIWDDEADKNMQQQLLNKFQKELERRNLGWKPSELLKQKEWCQDVYARDRKGHETTVYSPDACMFCITGAIQFCYPSSIDRRLEAANKLINMLGLEYHSHIPQWNDTPGRTKEEVIALLESVGE